MSPAKSAKDAKVKSELPAASCGVSEERDENYPKGVTPFLSGVPSEFRLDSRCNHAGMTVFGKKISST